MQAVILAAGRGTRMKELTERSPKALLTISGRTLLEYTLDALPDDVDEVIVIVGYLGSMIHERLGPNYFGKKILYVEQEELYGTADALWCAKDVLHERFLVLMADDIYSRRDVEAIAKAKDWAIGVARIPSLVEGGKIETDKKGRITDIIEGAHNGAPGLASTNLFCLDTRLFSQPRISKAPGAHEFGLPQTILAASIACKIPLEAMEATGWIQITNQDDIRNAEKVLQRNG